MEKNLSKQNPIFIVGMPRSGTTLISSFLSAHPKITIPYSETHFLDQWMKRYSHLNLECNQDFELFWRQYSKSQHFSYLGIEERKTLTRILAMGKPSYKNVFTCILQEYASIMNKQRWGEKTPDHCFYLERILRWYPEARIIWMLRDSRAVTASHLNVPWAAPYVDIHAKKWQQNVQLLEQSVKDERVRIVQYEMLVSNPELELQTICEFVGETYSSKMLERSEANSPVINRHGWAQKHLQNTFKPVNTNTIDKWKSSLSSTQITLVECITRDQMLKYGYQPVTKGLNLFQWGEFIFSIALRKLKVFMTQFLIRKHQLDS